MLGDLAAPFDPAAADSDISDNKPSARRHLIFETQDLPRGTAHDAPVVAHHRAVRLGPPGVVVAGDVQADGLAQRQRKARARERSDVELDAWIHRCPEPRWRRLVVVPSGTRMDAALR